MKKSEILSCLFFCRRDVVAVAAPWGRGRGKGAPCPVAVNCEEHLLALLGGHVLGNGAPEVEVRYKTQHGAGEAHGRFRIGSYTPNPDGTTRWACIDFDGAGHSDALADPLGAARMAATRASSMGLAVHLERSGSGTGWHVWFLFDAPVQAAAARKLCHALAPVVQLEDGTDADAKSGRGIEVFPKQDTIRSAGGLGNLVWLPWWSGAPDGGSVFCDLEGNEIDIGDLETIQPSQVVDALVSIAPKQPNPGRAKANPSEWRARALERLSLETVYGGLLTGRASSPGWLECRDPWSSTGDKNPSAGVADGSGEAERGAFHSFRTGETISVFDYLMRKDGVEFRDAADLVARWSGVERESRERTRETPVPSAPPSVLGSGVDPRTDMANAQRFAAAYGPQVRYCPERGGWLCWDGSRWAIDPEGIAARTMMRECAAELVNEAQAMIDRIMDAMKTEDDPQAKASLTKERSAASKLRTWARDSQQSGRVASSLKAAEELPEMMIQASVLDSDPWMLNCRNGCVDLRNGTLTTPSPEMMLTRIANAEWGGDAPAPQWEAFLERVLPDESVRGWVQRWAGTCLTGIISDRVIVMLVGTGANGKSVFLDALDHALGDYAGVTSPEFFASLKNPGTSREYQVAQIEGVRLLRASETESGAVLNESLLKQITGGDKCQGRHPYGRHFEFHPICKPVVSTNNRPTLRDTSRAIFDRLAPVEFKVRFERDDQDRKLTDKLRGEAGGVLQWAYRGLQAWLADGGRLKDCAAIVESVSEYRRDEDPLGDFMETRVIAEDDLRVSVADLFACYLEAMTAEKTQKPLTKVKFGKALKSRGFVQSSPIRGVRYWIGLALRDSEGNARNQDRVNQPEIDFTEARKASRDADAEWK